jgi:hypothetical protein
MDAGKTSCIHENDWAQLSLSGCIEEVWILRGLSRFMKQYLDGEKTA